MHNGSVINVNEQYIQDSIWYPEKDVVAGYGPVSKMNSFKGQLDEEDVNDVIAFLKYLKDPSLVSDDPVGESGATENRETQQKTNLRKLRILDDEEYRKRLRVVTTRFA